MIPKHIIRTWGSARKFKQEKRQQIEDIRRLASYLRAGCAFFPRGGDDVKIITDAIARLKDECSVKKWGR